MYAFLQILKLIFSVLWIILQIDNAFENEGGVVATSSGVGRIVYSPTGPLNKDYSDVRCFAEAAEKGIKRYTQIKFLIYNEWMIPFINRALSAGVKRPLLSISSTFKSYPLGNLASVLGALHALYVVRTILLNLKNMWNVPKYFFYTSLWK